MFYALISNFNRTIIIIFNKRPYAINLNIEEDPTFIGINQKLYRARPGKQQESFQLCKMVMWELYLEFWADIMMPVMMLIWYTVTNETRHLVARERVRGSENINSYGWFSVICYRGTCKIINTLINEKKLSLFDIKG